MTTLECKKKYEIGLTTTVGIGGLCRAILQAVQYLSFPDITVSHQQKLEKVVIALHRTALGAHLPSPRCPPQSGRRRRQRELTDGAPVRKAENVGVLKKNI